MVFAIHQHEMTTGIYIHSLFCTLPLTRFLITQEQELLIKLDFNEIPLGALSYSTWETFKTKQRTAHYLYIC